MSLCHTAILPVSNGVAKNFNMKDGLSHNKLCLHKLWRKSFRVYEWQSEILTVLNGVSINFNENNGIFDNNW